MMKILPAIHSSALALALALSLSQIATTTHAQSNAYWDAGNTNNGDVIDPADGVWVQGFWATNFNWNVNGTNQGWVDGDRTFFVGSNGTYTVTLGDNFMTSASMFFQVHSNATTSAFTLAGSGGNTNLIIDQLYVWPGATATVASNLVLEKTTGGNLYVGRGPSGTGTPGGTINIADTATLKHNGNFRCEGIGTVVNVSDTMQTSGRVQIGTGRNESNYVADITLNILSGGVVRSLNDVWEVGFMGSGTPTNAPNVQGLIVVQDGGTLEAGSAFDKDMRLGQFGTGTLTVQSGGTVKAGNLVLGNGGEGAGILNLDGGVVNTSKIDIKKPNSVVNFNGGTVKATASNTNDFLRRGSLTTGTINVRDGGVVIDSAGFDIGQNGPFKMGHSTIPGDNPVDGGLTKKGLGQLILGANNTYTGPTIVEAGTLVLKNANLDKDAPVTVATGAVLQLDFALTNKAVAGLTLGGVSQPDGIYNAANSAPFLTGVGGLNVQNPVVPTAGNPENVQLDGSNITFDITNSAGIYRVQSATNMASPVWVDIATNAAPFSFTNDANLPQQYYRTVTP